MRLYKINKPLWEGIVLLKMIKKKNNLKTPVQWETANPPSPIHPTKPVHRSCWFFIGKLLNYNKKKNK